MPDVVADLGYLALGTRLKRLAEQLQLGVAEALASHGYEVQPGQLPVLIAIANMDGPAVADLANALGLSQPGISRTLGNLAQAGLATIRPDENDARTRRAYLTSKSASLIDSLQTNFFDKVAAAAAELCDGLNLPDALRVLEQRNRELSFAERIQKAQQ